MSPTKIIAALLVPLILLSACGPMHQFNTAMHNQVNAEERALAAVVPRIKQECKYAEARSIPPREEAISNFECKDKIFKEVYLPVTAAPDLFMTFSSKYRSLTVDYAEGRISKEKMKAEYALIESEYFQQISQRYRAAQAQAMQREQEFSRQLQQLGQTLQQQNSYHSREGSCSPIDIAPLASPGCKNICINGRWAEVCG